jgi:hypothetical protein
MKKYMYDVVKNRKVKYGELLNERAPLLETINQAIGANSVDNINLNRLIDFQINCGILCNEKWRLFKRNEWEGREGTLSRCLKH